MSRIGLKEIPVPANVTVTVTPGGVAVKGPLGELAWAPPAVVAVKVEGAVIQVTRRNEEPGAAALHGTARSLIANMIAGVAQGYAKELEIQGVGYKAQLKGPLLVLALGYSHPIEFKIPAGIKVEVASDSVNLKVSGADKQLVGDVCAMIRRFAPAEPYKGKGVRYKGEYVRRKAGKTVA